MRDSPVGQMQVYWVELEFTRRDGVLPALIRQVLVAFSVLVFLLRELRGPAAAVRTARQSHPRGC